MIDIKVSVCNRSGQTFRGAHLSAQLLPYGFAVHP